MHAHALKLQRPARPVFRHHLLAPLYAAIFWLLEKQRGYERRIQLVALDDATLRDVGLSRSDLRAALNKSLWRF
ncbi:DUF1127 domain-containing protein [Ferrovibrio sp.]|uniref:DUF1127 domain-containing protein n=1 Tax=Ferrovibrio sp. TaxID=1917215 RepID=UPI0025B8C6B4|nr:DUF1127 domain-containing protein [Ferrovibrio sp.]MBX3452952.1 DUF1127 domain-containing protein [Ferrovibrio sp.]